MTKKGAVQRAVLAQVKRWASRFATDYQAIQEQIKASPAYFSIITGYRKNRKYQMALQSFYFSVEDNDWFCILSYHPLRSVNKTRN